MAATTSASFDRQTEVTLARGESVSFAGYGFRFEGTRTIEQAYRRSAVADLTLLRGGREAGRLTPLMNFYPSARDPIGTPSIRTGTPLNGFRDLYVSAKWIGDDGGSAAFRIYMNPGVTWLWIGGVVMALGGLLAAWPKHPRPAQEQR